MGSGLRWLWTLRDPRVDLTHYPTLRRAGGALFLRLRERADATMVVDAATGAVRGILELPGELDEVVALGSGFALRCSHSGAPTGEFVWVGTPEWHHSGAVRELTTSLVTFDASLNPRFTVVIPTLTSVVDGAAFIGAYAHPGKPMVHVLDAATGRLLRTMDGMVLASATLSERGLISFTDGPIDHPEVGVFAWDLAAGTKRLVRSHIKVGQLAVSGKRAVYVTAYDSDDHAELGLLDLDDGRPSWEMPAGPGYGLVVDGSSVLAYAAPYAESRLACFDVDTGRMRWAVPNAECFPWFGFLGSKLVAVGENAAHVFDREDGAPNGVHPLHSFVDLGPDGLLDRSDDELICHGP